MKCSCSKMDFRDAINAVSKALPAKAQTPILNGIYISAENNNLVIQATDFSLGIIAKIPAEIDVEGAVVLPGKFSAEIASKLPGALVTISNEEDNNSVTLKSDTAEMSFYTMNAEEFPKVPTQDFQNSFTVKKDILRRLIERSTFACAGADDSRPIFKGCSFTVKDSEIIAVATNTHRLSVVKAEFDGNISEEIKCIVPAAALIHLIGIINSVSSEDGVKIDISEKQIAFTVKNYFVTCRLIDGMFPPHDKVIPASSETFAYVNVKELKAAINFVSTAAKLTEYHTVNMSFKNDGVDVSADSYNLGKGTQHIGARIEGQEINISFNIDYLIDFLRIYPEDELKIAMNDALSPAEFNFDEDDEFIYVVTPIRTQ